MGTPTILVIKLKHGSTGQIKMHRWAKFKIFFINRMVSESQVDSKSKMLQDKIADYESLTPFY